MHPCLSCSEQIRLAFVWVETPSLAFVELVWLSGRLAMLKPWRRSRAAKTALLQFCLEAYWACEIGEKPKLGLQGDGNELYIRLSCGVTVALLVESRASLGIELICEISERDGHCMN